MEVVRVGVQFDGEGESSKELHLLIFTSKKAVGELPSFW